MGEEQGGVSLAAFPLGEGLSGTPLLPQTPQHPQTIPWGKGALTVLAQPGGFGVICTELEGAWCCPKPLPREEGEICPWSSQDISQAPASPGTVAVGADTASV